MRALGFGTIKKYRFWSIINARDETVQPAVHMLPRPDPLLASISRQSLAHSALVPASHCSALPAPYSCWAMCARWALPSAQLCWGGSFRSRICHMRPLVSICPADLPSHDGFQRVVLLNPGNLVPVYLMSFSPAEDANVTVSNYSVQCVARGWTRGVRCFPALRNLPSESSWTPTLRWFLVTCNNDQSYNSKHEADVSEST